MRRGSEVTRSAFLALLGACALGAFARAGESKQAQAGRDLYEQNCEVCHGADGRGKGPLAEALRDRPADLTEIAKRRNGVFPDVEVREIIDGRRKVRAHGSGDMPIWGRAFGRVAGEQNEEAIRDKISALVEYLRSIQRGSSSTVGQR